MYGKAKIINTNVLNGYPLKQFYSQFFVFVLFSLEVSCAEVTGRLGLAVYRSRHIAQGQRTREDPQIPGHHGRLTNPMHGTMNYGNEAIQIFSIR